MAVTAFLGMTGTGQWTSDDRPTSYRETILQLFPNGDMPLTAITAKGRNEKVDDPEFHWFEKSMAAQGGLITAISVTSGSSQAVGTPVTLTCAAETAQHFRRGHTAIVVVTTDFAKRIWGKVTDVQVNGASSTIRIILKQASTYCDDINAAIGTNAAYIDIVGSASPEGSTIPDAIGYKSTKYTGYTEIFRTSLDITRTQRLTKMRLGDPYTMLKAEALFYHGIEMEMAALFHTATELDGDNGQKERTTWGIIPYTETYSSDNILTYPSSSTPAWLAGGEDWLDEAFEQLFRYGRDTKVAFCGSGALLGIQKLVKLNGNFSFTPETAAYGIKVVRWVTPFGEILLKRHPLMTFKSYLRNSVVIFEPENVRFRYMTDTTFQRDLSDVDKLAERAGYDGTKEGYLTEGGYEFNHPETFMILKGVGEDGTLTE